MKKIILFIALVFTMTQAFTQKIELGVRAGAGGSFWTVKEAGAGFTPKLISSYEGGGFIVVPLSRSFFVQPELLFTSNGSRIKSDEVNDVYRLNYLSVPVFGKYKLSNGIGFLAGPEIGFLLNGTREDENGKEKINEYLQKSDMRFTLGVEYPMDFGLIVAARYTKGLTDIYKNEGFLKNNSFGISFGYRIR
jgi:hypothetical protein